jgi:hypothetical protein
MIMKSLPTMLLVTLLSCLWLTIARLPADAKQIPAGAQEEVPTVDFCEMVKHPATYFDKKIRITAAYQIGYEGSNLINVRCVHSYDDSIGAAFVTIDEEQVNAINRGVDTIMSGKAGAQPRVTVVGILRNSSRHDFASYRYRFDIIRFEDIREDMSERIVSYNGTLQAGLTYRAMVKHDSNFALSFSSPLRVPIHQAINLEWTNLKEFRALELLRGTDQKQIVFCVTKDDVQQMEPRRWNRALQLEILLVE